MIQRTARAAPAIAFAMISPLSGPWAREGELQRGGAEMAINDINQSGGIKALGGVQVRLVQYDASDSAEKAKNAAQRMIAQEPDIIGGFGAWLSTFTLAVTEVTERAEIPWFTQSYSDLITSRGYRYIFQSSPTAVDQAEKALPAILDLAERTTGKRPKKVAIISDNTASSVSFLKPIRGHVLADLGLTAVVDEVFTPPLADATTLIQRVRSARPDFLLALPSNVSDDKRVLDKLAEGLACYATASAPEAAVEFAADAVGRRQQMRHQQWPPVSLGPRAAFHRQRPVVINATLADSLPATYVGAPR